MSRRGFTLLELLVALVIMVLISGVAVLSFGSSLAESRLRAGARTVISMLRSARSYAVAHRTDAAVSFDLANRAVTVMIPETDEEGSTQWRALTTPAGHPRALPETVLIADVQTDLQAESAGVSPSASYGTDEGGPMVTFSLLGQTTDASITLSGAHGKQIVILVDGITGHCEIADEEQQR